MQYNECNEMNEMNIWSRVELSAQLTLHFSAPLFPALIAHKIFFKCAEKSSLWAINSKFKRLQFWDNDEQDCVLLQFQRIPYYRKQLEVRERQHSARFLMSNFWRPLWIRRGRNTDDHFCRNRNTNDEGSSCLLLIYHRGNDTVEREMKK